MCDPLTIGALALSAAGAGVNAYESNKTQNRMIGARNSATQAELGRQQGYQAKSNQLFDTSMAGFTPEAQAPKLTGAQDTVAGAFQQNAPTAQSVGSISTGSAPAVVATSEGREVGDVLGLGAKSNQARGKLAGWSQRQVDNGMNINATNRGLDLNTDLSKTSAGVGRLEQDAKYRNAFRPNSGIGDIMQLGGQIGAFSAGKGGVAPKAAAPGAPLNILPPAYGGAPFVPRNSGAQIPALY